MKFFIVDAFSDEIFGGNAAGVVVYDNVPDSYMKGLAAELKFSETAFIKPLDANKFDIRFFTPNAEVELCGHATIASFSALRSAGYITANGKYLMNTLSGLLPVYVEDNFIMMEQASPVEGIEIDDVKTLADIMKIPEEEIGDCFYQLEPQIISTGLFDIMLPVKTKETLNRISPNYFELSEFSKIYNVVGIHAFTLDSNGYTANCRNFAPLYGINEEAATGTSNGALTYYLYIHNVINELDTNYMFSQGESMNRPSVITTRIEKKPDLKILCGGRSRIISKGELYI
jgi:PhzF family phenazine biosynthesis protein